MKNMASGIDAEISSEKVMSSPEGTPVNSQGWSEAEPLGRVIRKLQALKGRQ